MEINIHDKGEQRKFGLLMAGIIGGLGLYRWWHHDFTFVPWGFLGVAVCFLVFGLAWPKGLTPLFWAWMKLAVVLNFLMMHLVLTISFYLLITPTRIILSLRGHDTLKRKWLPNAPTYWEEAEEQPTDPARYRNMY